MNDVFGNLELPGYEEITSYGPPFLTELKEMDAVYQFAGKLTDMMAEDIEGIIDNQFVLLMDDVALEKMEMFLGIPVDTTISLEYRRKNVLALLHASRKFNKTTIVDIINSYAEANCIVTLIPGILDIDILFVGNPANFMGEIIRIILDRMPCHLQLKIAANITSINNVTNYIGVTSNITKITEIGGITIE